MARFRQLMAWWEGEVWGGVGRDGRNVKGGEEEERGGKSKYLPYQTTLCKKNPYCDVFVFPKEAHANVVPEVGRFWKAGGCHTILG